MTRADIDAILDERARVLARPVVRDAEVPSVELVQFSAGNERYAIEASYVQRLEKLDRVAPLPGAARHVAGLTNFHGQLVPLIDLRVLLGAAPSGATPYAIVLGESRAELGIVAEELSEIRLLPLDQLSASGSRAKRGLVRQILADGSAVIDAAALLADPLLVAGDLPNARPSEETR